MSSRLRLAAFLSLFVIGGCATKRPTHSAGPVESVFPPGTFSPFLTQWYSKQLRGLGEGLLQLDGAETYRFTWLRSFHHPILIRVVRDRPGATLVVREADGAGGYEPGQVIVSRTERLSEDQWNRLMREPGMSEQWASPVEEKDVRGCDGAEWILEGVRDGRYHAMTWWSPIDDRSPELIRFKRACMKMLDLADIHVTGDDFY